MTRFAVLTSSGGVADAVADEVREALAEAGATCDAPNRLAPGAVEIAFDGLERTGIAAPHGVDLNQVPAENRQKRILIADMDSTMIPVECIDELADFAGVKAQVSEITEQAMQGVLDFEEAIHARVGLLKDLPIEALEACYAERISLNPGAEEVISRMNDAGARTALVSGGFTFFTSRVAARTGFQSHQANTLLQDGDHLTGEVALPILGRQAKREALLALCKEVGTDPADVIAVGDGANDLDMIRAAGLGVAYHAKPALRAEADASLDHSDLRALLALQGLSHS